jgi:hypothetical protein
VGAVAFAEFLDLDEHSTHRFPADFLM